MKRLIDKILNVEPGLDYLESRIYHLVENSLQKDTPSQRSYAEVVAKSKVSSSLKRLYEYIINIVDLNSKTVEKYKQIVTNYDTSSFKQYIAFIDQLRNNQSYFTMTDSMVNKLHSLVVLKELIVQIEDGKDVQQLISMLDSINTININVDYEKVIQTLLPLEEGVLDSQLVASIDLFTVFMHYIFNELERVENKKTVFDEIPVFKQYTKLFNKTLKRNKSENEIKGWAITANDLISFIRNIPQYDEISRKTAIFAMFLIKEAELYSQPVGIESFKYWMEFLATAKFQCPNTTCNLFLQTAKLWFVLNILTKIDGVTTSYSEEADIRMLETKLIEQSTIISQNIIHLNDFIQDVLTLFNYSNVDLMALNVFNNIIQELKTGKSELLETVVAEIETLGKSETIMETTDVPYDMERDFNSFINFMQVWDFENNKPEFDNNQKLMEFIFPQKH